MRRVMGLNVLPLGEARALVHQTRCAVLGLDVGATKIGLAVWRHGETAPLETIRRQNLQGIRDIVAECRVGLLAVGWPLELSGNAGSRCRDVQQFLLDLRALEVHTAAVFCDERWTSAAAGDALKTAGVVRRTKRSRLEDPLAASLFIDMLLGV